MDITRISYSRIPQVNVELAGSAWILTLPLATFIRAKSQTKHCTTRLTPLLRTFFFSLLWQGRRHMVGLEFSQPDLFPLSTKHKPSPSLGTDISALASLVPKDLSLDNILPESKRGPRHLPFDLFSRWPHQDYRPSPVFTTNDPDRLHI